MNWSGRRCFRVVILRMVMVMMKKIGSNRMSRYGRRFRKWRGCEGEWCSGGGICKFSSVGSIAYISGGYIIIIV